MHRSASLTKRWPAALVVLSSFALRVFRLGDANLWWDEALAIWAIRKGFAGVTAWTAADVHPPLYFWSLWGWVQLFGESELASRLLSVVFGVLTVIVVYRLGRRLGGERLGLLAAFLTGFSRFHIWWSQELRMYVLAGLLGTLSLYHFLGWLRAENAPCTRRRENWWHLGASVLAGLGSLYTVLIMAGLVLVQNLVALGFAVAHGTRERLGMLVRWAAGQAAVLAGLAAWMAYSWGAMSTWSVAQPFGWARAARLYATLLITGISVEIERYGWQVALPMALFVVGSVVGVSRWRARGRARVEGWDVMTLALAAFVPPVLVYLATLPRALFYTPRLEARYLVAFAPAFWVLFAWGLDALIDRWRAAGWACAGAVAVIWLTVLPGHYTSRYLGDELQSMARTIASQSRQGDLVLLNSGTRYPIWSYYYGGLDWTTPKPPVMLLGDDSQTLTAERVALELPCAIGNTARVWLAEVDIGLTDPNRLVASLLDERYTQVQALGFGPNALRLYDVKGQPPALTEGYRSDYQVICLGDAYALRGIDMPVPVVAAGEHAQIGLLWDHPPAESRLVLQNADGLFLLARRMWSEDRVAPWRQQIELALPREMPRGAYSLLLELSDEGYCELLDIRVVGDRQPRISADPAVAVDVLLDDLAMLTGYTLHHAGRRVAGQDEIAIKAGDTLVLDLYWSAQREGDVAYTVFAQLLGEAHNPHTAGPVWAQHDSMPAGYAAPTDAWREGDLILDRHVLVVDDQAPPGLYRLQVGMYDPATGERLPATGINGESLGDRILFSLEIRVRE